MAARPGSAGNLVRGAAGAVLFSALTIFVIVRVTGNGESWAGLVRVDRRFLLAAGGLVVAGWILDAVRIQTLLRALGGSLGFWSAFRITLAGAFVACVTPFDTGGEPLQVYLLHKHGFGAGESTAVIAVKTLISSFARLFLVLMFPVWYVIGRQSWALPRPVEAALFVGLVLYVSILALLGFFTVYPESVGAVLGRFLRNGLVRRIVPPHLAEALPAKVRAGVVDFRAALNMFVRERRVDLTTTAALSLLGWAIAFSVPVLLLRGLGVDSPFAQTMGIAGVFYLAAAYAPTPGSSGAAEATVALLFAPVVPLRLLGVFVLLWRALTYYFTLLAGAVAIALSYVRFRPRQGGGRGE